MSDRPDWDDQFAETEDERNERQRAKRRLADTPAFKKLGVRAVEVELVQARLHAAVETLDFVADNEAAIRAAVRKPTA